MSAPHSLDGGEQCAWRTYIEATGLLLATLDRQLQRDSGMTLFNYEVLLRLAQACGKTMRMSELACASQSSRSRLSHAVARLEQRGWVRRSVCDTDRRGQLATLTDDGLAVLESAAAGHVAAVRAHLFDRLSGEQVRQLVGISTLIRTGIEQSA